MISYLNNQNKQECRKLWEEAFPQDSQSFIDYYFSEKIKDNRILVLKEEAEIAAMLHLNPYRIHVRGQVWHSDYIVGVATRQDKRRKGYMGKLLKQMLADLDEEGMPFCFLMPAAAGIYEPYDFVYIYDQPFWSLRPEYAAPDALERRLLPPDGSWTGNRTYMAAIAEWMNQWLKHRYQVFARRDEHYLMRLMKEIASEDGSFSVLYDGGLVVGYQSEWGTVKSEQRLLMCEPQYVRLDAEKPAIMARIVCLKQFLRAIRLKKAVAEKQPEVIIPIRVADSLLPENNGSWNWHLNGQTSWLEPNTDRLPETVLTIGELTEWLFGYRCPQAAARYLDVVDVLHGVFLDEVV